METVGEENLIFYRRYEAVFETELNRYQSRIYPLQQGGKLRWYHIKSEDSYIGAIWLEAQDGEEYAVLGILIADPGFRSKGIGTAAIQWMIEHDLPDMGVNQVLLRVRRNNTRAVACYEKAGFRESRRYQKGKIDVIEMVYRNREEKDMA